MAEAAPGGQGESVQDAIPSAASESTTPDAREDTTAQTASTDSPDTDTPSSDASPPPVDHSALWKQLESAPEKDVERWLRDNPNHPVARRMQANESRAAEKARADAKAAIEGERLAREEAKRLQDLETQRLADEAELDALYERHEAGDWEATEELAKRNADSRKRQKQLNDPTVLRDAARLLAINSTQGLFEHPDWDGLNAEALQPIFTDVFQNAKLPVELYGRIHKADIEDKRAKGALFTRADVEALIDAGELFDKKGVDALVAAARAEGKTVGLGGRPDPELARGVGGSNGAPHIWTREQIAGLSMSDWKTHKATIEQQVEAGLVH